MSMEAHSTDSGSVLETSPLLLREERDAANRWLVRFAPLLDPPETLDADVCRQRLAMVPALRAEGERALAALQAHAAPEDVELLATLRQAAGQLDGLADGLKRRLGALAPHDPEAAPDL